MRRHVLLSALLALPLFFAPGASLADPSRVSFLAERLQSDDFRVRTKAALALGAENDDTAVAPLCRALADANDVVRQTAAVGLKRLGRTSAVGCLKQRLSNESDATVKLQITRAIETLEPAAGASAGGSGGDSFSPKNVPNAKYYVSVSNITNNTGRPQAEIERIVLNVVRQKLDSLGNIQIAPPQESADAAKAAIAKRKLKGYYLSIAVDKFDYSDGNLRVRVKCAVFSYPGKDLRGEVPAGVTQTGVRPGDKGSEENLMTMAAGRVVELFAQNFQ